MCYGVCFTSVLAALQCLAVLAAGALGAHLRFAALSVAERLVDIKQQDECKYDAMVIYNFKSDADTAWVQKLMFELEGGNYPRLTDLEGTDGRVCETPITFVEYKVYV